jgi:hypothetical protein
MGCPLASNRMLACSGVNLPLCGQVHHAHAGTSSLHGLQRAQCGVLREARWLIGAIHGRAESVPAATRDAYAIAATSPMRKRLCVRLQCNAKLIRRQPSDYFVDDSYVRFTRQFEGVALVPVHAKRSAIWRRIRSELAWSTWRGGQISLTRDHPATVTPSLDSNSQLGLDSRNRRTKSCSVY